LREQLVAFEPEIRAMVDYCIDTSGKRIRPTLVFLSGWQGAPRVQPELVRVAAVVELVHLATLVHDDIMDEADLRRSRMTVARKYGSPAAVLLGDALFAHALHLATQFPTTEICAAVSASTRRVCAGEIVQTLRRRSTNITRDEYWRIVDLKTAELFRVSCLLGARLAGFSDEYVEAVSRFGRHLGIAYQIYDDLVDFFGEEGRIGKTLGTDLASGKLTLPLLVLLERLSATEAVVLGSEITENARPSSVCVCGKWGIWASFRSWLWRCTMKLWRRRRRCRLIMGRLRRFFYLAYARDCGSRSKPCRRIPRHRVEEKVGPRAERGERQRFFVLA
jgi:octaprenyl-diphosphate synthase